MEEGEDEAVACGVASEEVSEEDHAVGEDEEAYESACFWEEVDPAEFEGKLEPANTIGEGAFGTVYAVKWRCMTVAVKRLKGMNEAVIKMFYRELNNMTNLRSPHLVQFIAACTRQEPFLLITEYIDGGSLDQLLKRNKGGLPIEVVKELGADILTGIVYMHSRNVIHRDLKPANILLTRGERLKAKIADFGCTRPITNSPLSVNGTCAYMAPEMIRGGGRYAKPVDIYSFGILLYEMVVGSNPFVDMQIIPLSQLVGDGGRPPFPEDTLIHRELKTLIKQCWAQEPEARPTAEETMDLLQQIPIPLHASPGKRTLSLLQLVADRGTTEEPTPVKKEERCSVT